MAFPYLLCFLHDTVRREEDKNATVDLLGAGRDCLGQTFEHNFTISVLKVKIILNPIAVLFDNLNLDLLRIDNVSILKLDLEISL